MIQLPLRKSKKGKTMVEIPKTTNKLIPMGPATAQPSLATEQAQPTYTFDLTVYSSRGDQMDYTCDYSPSSTKQLNVEASNML